MPVKMELTRVLIRETSGQHVVELREVEGKQRVFPIVIGLNEAAAIERRVMGQEPLRPQTHDLLANIIDVMGGKLEEVVISDLKEHTFFARLRIRQGEHLLDIDSRPSDAIALGAASDVPIYVAEHVLEEVSKAG
jgi:bifunctional DNase/RNase